MTPIQRATVIEWVNTDFRQALNDPERLKMSEAVLKVGYDKGDPPSIILRNLIAQFVCDLVGAIESETNQN